MVNGIVLVTDPPYGRSVKGIGADEISIVKDFIENALKHFGPDMKIVLSLPTETLEKLFTAKKDTKKPGCLMYVHNRLTRKIMVIEND
jgi:tRNA G10  N-methylase Trm11